jgi:hypothetical protein
MAKQIAARPISRYGRRPLLPHRSVRLRLGPVRLFGWQVLAQAVTSLDPTNAGKRQRRASDRVRDFSFGKTANGQSRMV